MFLLLKDKAKFEGYTEVLSPHDIKLDKCPFLVRNNKSCLVSPVTSIGLCPL